MDVFEYKVKLIISAATSFFSIVFGDLWFLFVFLIILNILDCITGTMKARYLKIESSKAGLKGLSRTIFTWILILISFGLGSVFFEIGEYIGKNLRGMMCIGWFTLVYCIMNEVRSILENLVQMDKGNIIPPWFTRGLEVAQKMTDKKANEIINKFDKEDKENG